MFALSVRSCACMCACMCASVRESVGAKRFYHSLDANEKTSFACECPCVRVCVLDRSLDSADKVRCVL